MLGAEPWKTKFPGVHIMRKSGLALSILCLFRFSFLSRPALSIADTGSSIRTRIVLPGAAAPQGGMLPFSISAQSSPGGNGQSSHHPGAGHICNGDHYR